MRVRLNNCLMNPMFSIAVIGMAVLFFFHEQTSIYYYLTIAQLFYVPLVVHTVATLKRWQKICIMCGQIVVVLLYFVDAGPITFILSIGYGVSMFAVFIAGIRRFMHRGFVHMEEIMIDIGLLYSMMAAVWYIAYVNKIQTGFTELITWLTAIHFHYSAILLCIVVGLIGRVIKAKYYTVASLIIATGPLVVAIGITFSRTIEILGVSFYVAAIFYVTASLLKMKHVVKFPILVAFLTLCFTIIWSFLYALSNFLQTDFVTIPDMLAFHGRLNCFLFGSAVTLAVVLFTPKTKFQGHTFPRSNLTSGHLNGQPHDGLIDRFSLFQKDVEFPTEITHFYEHTSQYRLHAIVKWSWWMKPFKRIYKWISTHMQQLNLPITAEQVEMHGNLFLVEDERDCRQRPRVWQRKIHEETVFTAIYSVHQENGQAFMNIALPLPNTTMHGILHVHSDGEKVWLTSDAAGDAGTYLAFRKWLIQLPLHEYFQIEAHAGKLKATHYMKVFGIRFLHITYAIQKKHENCIHEN